MIFIIAIFVQNPLTLTLINTNPLTLSGSDAVNSFSRRTPVLAGRLFKSGAICHDPNALFYYKFALCKADTFLSRPAIFGLEGIQLRENSNVSKCFYFLGKGNNASNREDLLAEFKLLQNLGTHENVILVLGGVTKTGKNTDYNTPHPATFTHATPQPTTPQPTTPHYTTLHCTALHCTALHCTAPHRTAPHRTAPHRTAPHRTAPHHIHYVHEYNI